LQTPIYQKIENDIKTKIERNELKSGDIIPSENQLTQLYDVSRMTVRQALNNLVSDGYLYKHKGKGTFVSQRKIEKNIHGVRGFTEEMEDVGRVVKSEVVKFEKVLPPKHIADKLFLDHKHEAFYIERIRYADDVPVLFEVLYVPYDLFKDLTIEHMTHSFYDYIHKNTIYQISHCFQIIEAKPADSDIVTTLKVAEHTPVLSIIRNTFLNNGRPFEYVVATYRSDQYKFVQYAFKN